MPALDITRHRLRHATLLGVAGEIDLATEPALRAALHPLPDEHLIVDLTAVGFLSAGGLRCLLDAHDRLRASRRTLVIVESSPVRRLITVTGLDRTLHVVGDRTAARALLSAGRCTAAGEGVPVVVDLDRCGTGRRPLDPARPDHATGAGRLPASGDGRLKPTPVLGVPPRATAPRPWPDRPGGRGGGTRRVRRRVREDPVRSPGRAGPSGRGRGR